MMRLLYMVMLVLTYNVYVETYAKDFAKSFRFCETYWQRWAFAPFSLIYFSLFPYFNADIHYRYPSEF
jgi:hypothetical protein